MRISLGLALLAAAARADAPRTDEAVAQCLATPDGACDASAPCPESSEYTRACLESRVRIAVMAELRRVFEAHGAIALEPPLLRPRLRCNQLEVSNETGISNTTIGRVCNSGCCGRAPCRSASPAIFLMRG